MGSTDLGAFSCSLFSGRLEARRNIRSAGESRRAASPSPWSPGASGPVPPCSPPRYSHDRYLLGREAERGGVCGEPCGRLMKQLVPSINVYYLLGSYKVQLGPCSLEAKIQLEETNS